MPVDTTLALGWPTCGSEHRYSWQDYAETRAQLLDGRMTVVAQDLPLSEADANPAASPLWRWLEDPEHPKRTLIVLIHVGLTDFARNTLYPSPLAEPAEPANDGDPGSVDDAERPWFEFAEADNRLVSSLTGGRVFMDPFLRFAPQRGAENVKPLKKAWDDVLHNVLSGCVFVDRQSRAETDGFDLRELPRDRDVRCGHVLVGYRGEGRVAVLPIGQLSPKKAPRFLDERSVIPAVGERAQRRTPDAREAERLRQLVNVIKNSLPGRPACPCGQPDCRRPTEADWSFEATPSPARKFKGVVQIPLREMELRSKWSGQKAAFLEVLINAKGASVPNTHLIDAVMKRTGSTAAWSGMHTQLLSRIRGELRKKHRVCSLWIDQCLRSTDTGTQLDPRAVTSTA